MITQIKSGFHIFLFVSITGLMYGCGGESSGSTEDSASVNGQAQTPEEKTIQVSRQQFESAGMELGKLQKHTFPQTIKVNGMLDVPPKARNKVSTFMGGYVKSIPLLEGDMVKRGQFLVSLENTDYVELQQGYLEAREQLEYLKAEYDRQKALSQENISSQKSFKKAESDFRTMKARYEGFLKKLKMLNINPDEVNKGNLTSVINMYAPIDGYVTNVYASAGAYSSPQDVIIEIVNTDHIHLELNVFEKDVMKVNQDQDITFRIPDSGSETYQAKVHLVGRSIENESRTVKVHGHLTKEDKNVFVPGMFVEAEIVVNSRDGFGLPSDAVVSQEDNQYILVKTQEKQDTITFEKVKVNVGYTSTTPEEKLSEGTNRPIQEWSEVSPQTSMDTSSDVLIKGSFDLAGEM